MGARRPRPAVPADPRARRAQGRRPWRALPAAARRGRVIDPELLPRREAAAGARPGRSPASRTRDRRRAGSTSTPRSRPSGGPWPSAACRYRVEATADLAILQFAKFRLWKDLDENWAELSPNPLVAHLIHSPTEPFADPVPADRRGRPRRARRQPARSPPTLRSWARRGGDRRADVRPRRPAGHREVADHHQPARPRRGRRASGCCSSPRSGPRSTSCSSGSTPSGMGAVLRSTCTTSGSKPAAVREQIRARLDHACRRRRAGPGRTEDLRAARRRTRPLRRRPARAERRRALLYSARVPPMLDHRRGRGADADPRCAAVQRRGPRRVDADPAICSARCPRSPTPPDPRPDHPWAFVDDRRPAVDVAAVRAAAVRFDAALAALRVRRSAGARGGRARPLTWRSSPTIAGSAACRSHVLDETRTPRWREATDCVDAEIGAFAAAAHPGLDVVTPAALDAAARRDRTPQAAAAAVVRLLRA